MSNTDEEKTLPETYVMVTLGAVSVVLAESGEHPTSIEKLGDMAMKYMDALFGKAKTIPGLT